MLGFERMKINEWASGQVYMTKGGDFSSSEALLFIFIRWKSKRGLWDLMYTVNIVYQNKLDFENHNVQ